MALKEAVKDTIIRVAKEYGARRLWLFGSSLDPSTDEPNDIDLAVEGIPPARFFEFYAKLGRAIPNDIDLIDMESDDPMRHIVRDRGVILYE
ncbi:MAG: nucleotidyltransferase domain-containing protein [bacterium]